MKKIYLLIFSFGIIKMILASDLSEANRYLKSGEYEKAIEVYESRVEEGYVSFELFYNLGVAYNKQNNQLKALLNFEKAALVNPLNSDTRSQINDINISLVDKPPIYDSAGLMSVLSQVQFMLSIDTWAILSIFFMILIPVSVFMVYKFKRFKGRSAILGLCIVWFLLSGLCVLMARNGYHYKYLHLQGLVNKESISVKSTPESNSAILFNLHQATKVEVTDSVESMFHIKFIEQEGWVAKSDILRITL